MHARCVSIIGGDLVLGLRGTKDLEFGRQVEIFLV